MRIRVLAVVVISACTVGTTGPGGSPGGGGSPDASQGGVDAPSGSIDAPMGSGSGSGSNGCVNQVTTGLGDGHHNSGQDCMNACHNHGFTLAGTVYTSVNSNTAVTGATISVTDANGQHLKIVTQLNGNFYTSQAVAFPLTAIERIDELSSISIASTTSDAAQPGGGVRVLTSLSTVANRGGGGISGSERTTASVSGVSKSRQTKLATSCWPYAPSWPSRHGVSSARTSLTLW